MTNNLIKKYNREDKTIWGARPHDRSDALYAANPNILKFFSVARVMQLYLAYIVGLAPFIKIHEDSLQVPFFTQDFYQWKLLESPNAKARIGIHV